MARIEQKLKILRFIQLSVWNYVNRNIGYINSDVKICYLVESKGIYFFSNKKNAQAFNLDAFEFFMDPLPRFAWSRMTAGEDYFRKFMYGSLLASSCTLSALAMRAERACQEPSRN